MNIEDVEQLEKVTGQLEGLHREFSLLAKKSSTDALNGFKLKILNGFLSVANEILGAAYKPIEEFDLFDPDDVPSNSDATVVLTSYLEELERYRSDNIENLSGYYFYIFDDDTRVRTNPPKRLQNK
ncbi:hypothetical protein [Sphingorhabdus sp. SMR4y]|uniref:hypothetical protein n=1 Tax=Sphingorhabdus sp. SMR4y TaxID=2584094 RepID=UPI000B5C5DD2|nr:hypothetical protein [Sphingorhabdus sp. SMR4y]ASK88255.1 hypothetical protein SPHFLASMR4Y_01506 [Sphingorhabdus sp. SMR4y]